jgi:DNA polymerase-3 subunit delta'
LATGGSKAVKELEKEQKTRNSRLVRDNLDRTLLDLATVYKDILLLQSNLLNQITNIDLQNRIKQKAQETPPESVIKSVNSILEARSSLKHNSASNLTTEALLLFLRLAK